MCKTFMDKILRLYKNIKDIFKCSDRPFSYIKKLNISDFNSLQLHV